ncbi:hypothetical protein [Rhabdochromatium marinum]|uniref:hypothetical protein n=1 Tax=Rhabdochromatium marinum TaxID=48729 RepID=UPI0019033B80|nr:hypothetical protein [Rhabdochromatium marinum]
MADSEPRLGTLIDIEPEVLVVAFEDAPGQAPERIPQTERTRTIAWQPGMAVRVWPASIDTNRVRISPLGTGGRSLDLTGVRRRLSRGRRNGFGGSGSGGGGLGGGHGRR